jgi:hypothetical protein
MPLVTQSYKLIARIGAGPTGTAWQARHRVTGEPFAAKILAAHLATEPQTVTRFTRERHLLTVTVEPTLVPVRVLLVGDGELALVSELIPGPAVGAQRPAGYQRAAGTGRDQPAWATSASRRGERGHPGRRDGVRPVLIRRAELRDRPAATSDRSRRPARRTARRAPR